jgi:hypothetical protein
VRITLRRARWAAVTALATLSACAPSAPPVRRVERVTPPAPPPKDVRTVSAFARAGVQPQAVATQLTTWGQPVDPARLFPASLRWLNLIAAPGARVGYAWGIVSPGAQETALGIAVPITSVDAAIAAATQAGYRRGVSESGRIQLLRADNVCAVSPATPALVCSSHPNWLADLERELLRGAEPSTPASNAWLSVVPEPLERSLGDKLGPMLWPLALHALGIESRNAEFDAALGKVITALTTEGSAVFSDVSRASADLTTGSETAVLGVRLQFEARTSWLAGLLNDPAPAAAPDTFSRLPGDATRGFFATGLTRERYTSARELLSELLHSLLAYQGTPEQLRVSATRLISQLPLPQASFAFASGELEATDKTPLVTQELGWHLVALDEPAAHYLEYLDEVVELFGDPVLGSQLRRVARTLVDERWVPLEIKKDVRGTPGLPRGTRAWTVTLPGRSLDPRAGGIVTDRTQKSATTLIVVPDGTRTLLAWAGDQRALIAKLRAFLGAKEPRTLLTREDLAKLREGGLLWGGFGPEALYRLRVRPEQQSLDWEAELPGARAAVMLRELLSRASP